MMESRLTSMNLGSTIPLTQSLNLARRNRTAAGNRLPDDKLVESCQEFESILVKKILESIQPKGGLFGEGVQGEFYRDLFLTEMAAEITKDPGIGLAKSIYQSLSNRV